jgi:hypothetical protein
VKDAMMVVTKERLVAEGSVDSKELQPVVEMVCK